MHNFLFFRLYTVVLWSILNVIKNGNGSHKSGLSVFAAELSLNVLEGPVRRNRGISTLGLFIKARKHELLLMRKHTGDCTT